MSGTQVGPKLLLLLALLASVTSCKVRVWTHCWNERGERLTCCQSYHRTGLDFPEPTGPAVCEKWKEKP